VRAVRREGDAWSVAAKQIAVTELRDIPGEELLLTVQEGAASLEVDGMPTITGLDRVLAAVPSEHESYVVRATRVRDDLWDVDVAPL
jgi:hypothetical protein